LWKLSGCRVGEGASFVGQTLPDDSVVIADFRDRKAESDFPAAENFLRSVATVTKRDNSH
jgi:hypothetical protein